ncbi:MAG: sigma-54 dependent transcriptional regulator [Planctomycetota bacterium]
MDAAKDVVLVVEDEELIRRSVAARLRREGYEVVEAETGGEGIAALDRGRVDLVLLDYKLPDRDGIEILELIQPAHPGLVTIMMTAHGTIESAVRAMRAGAYHWIRKPFELDEIVEQVARGLETTRLRREVERLRREARGGGGAARLIGHSPWRTEIEETIARLNEVASSTVLILGESGTGKSLLAKRLHATSARARAPLMTITCTDFSESLLESELFGHEKGAFTGAVQAKRGLVELADGGTVFLDEIGDMPPSLQAKLLRFLEERRFRRVGGTREISVDVRVVAATNRDLLARVRDGRFREDLYYRLAVVPLEVPPLRERPEDVEDLARFFVHEFNAVFGREVEDIEPAAMAALRAHAWPGNVRELRNVIERSMILGRSTVLRPADLPRDLRDAAGVGASEEGAAPEAAPGSPEELAARVLGPEGIDLEALERALVVRALEFTSGNRSAAARLLGMSRDQMRYRIEKFDIAPE